MEDDAAILRRSLTARDCFAELFHRHAAAIGRYLNRRIGPHDAEDVLAETFLEAFRERHRYDFGRPDAGPWLYGIATHRLGRYRRTERKQFKILERTGADPIAAEFTERSDTRVDMGRKLVWVEPGLEPAAPARRTTYTATVVYSDYGLRFKVLHP